MKCKSTILPLPQRYRVSPDAAFPLVLHAREMLVQFSHADVDHCFSGCAPEVIHGAEFIGRAALSKTDQHGAFLLRDSGWDLSWRRSGNRVAVAYWNDRERGRRSFLATPHDLAILLESTVEEYVRALTIEVENYSDIAAVSDRIADVRAVIRDLLNK